jgi:glutamate-5-semialdehyde dehydrogenase
MMRFRMGEHMEPEMLGPAPEQGADSISNQEYVEELVKKAKRAAGRLASLSTSAKNQALVAMADGLVEKSDEILAANMLDLEVFGKSNESQAKADRLRLTTERIDDMAVGLREIAKLPDPVGETVALLATPERHAGRQSAGPDRCHRHHL